MKMKDVQVPMPPGADIEKGVFSGKFSGIFPVDSKIQPLLTCEEITGDFIAEGQAGNGVPINLTMKIQQKKTVESKPAK
jgi:hypothetical protein